MGIEFGKFFKSILDFYFLIFVLVFIDFVYDFVGLVVCLK